MYIESRAAAKAARRPRSRTSRSMVVEKEITMEAATELDTQYRSVLEERQQRFEAEKAAKRRLEREEVLWSIVSPRTAGLLS